VLIPFLARLLQVFLLPNPIFNILLRRQIDSYLSLLGSPPLTRLSTKQAYQCFGYTPRAKLGDRQGPARGEEICRKGTCHMSGTVRSVGFTDTIPNGSISDRLGCGLLSLDSVRLVFNVRNTLWYENDGKSHQKSNAIS